MLVVHVDVHVTEGSEAAFREATESNARASRQEAGVLRFDVLGDRADPRHFVLVEVYTDEGAAAAHKATGHYAAWRDAVADLMAVPRSSASFTALSPAAEDAWRTPGGASGDTLGWDG